MNNLNSSGSKLMDLINRIGTGILINLMFLIGCIPIVTIGASWCGLYSAVRYMVRGDGWFSGYKEGFKTNFIRTTFATVFGLAVGYYALDNFLPSLAMLLDGVEVGYAWVLLVVFGGLLLTVLLFLTVMVPVNIYIRTDYDRWLKNTFYLIGHAPLQCLVATALVWFPVYQAVFASVGFYFLLVGYVAAYFILAGVACTVMLKKPLIQLLRRERKAGTLLVDD